MSENIETEAVVVPEQEPAIKKGVGRGGQTTWNKYGPEFYDPMRAEGQKVTKRKYGLRFYSEIAAQSRNKKALEKMAKRKAEQEAEDQSAK